jgi:hypothetical protein
MEALIIEEGISTPKVILDKEKGKFEISGQSLPEDVMSFYKPIFEWIEEYLKQPNKKTAFNFRLMYFNSASSKIILDILTLLEQLAEKGFDIEILWHYLEMDEDMLSTGKEFDEMLKIPFQFLSYMQVE